MGRLLRKTKAGGKDPPAFRPPPFAEDVIPTA